MGFWHDTMHNSYVSPCKIPLYSSFPADPPKKFCSWLPFCKYNEVDANSLWLSSLVQQLWSVFPTLGNNWNNIDLLKGSQFNRHRGQDSSSFLGTGLHVLGFFFQFICHVCNFIKKKGKDNKLFKDFLGFFFFTCDFRMESLELLLSWTISNIFLRNAAVIFCFLRWWLSLIYQVNGCFHS